MILALIFALIFAIVFIILNSTVKICVNKFAINSINKKLDKCSYILIELYFLNKIRFLKFKLDSKKIRKIYRKNNLKQINIRNIKKYTPFTKDIINLFYNLNFKIVKLRFKLNIGTINIHLTTILILIISNIIPVILYKNADNKSEIKYIINPIYKDKNISDISLDCIINIEIVHIIYILIKILKIKRRVVKDVRTSDRRSYEYSYE